MTAVAAEVEYSDIRPQPGPQEEFLSCEADIAIYGGQAYGGKSYALLLDALRWTHIKGYGAVIFRRHSTDITQEGGLWDEAMGLYPLAGGRPRESQGRMDFRFPAGSRISFAHLQYEDSVERKQGGQIAVAGFDELTHFTQQQFFYMFSRLRSKCGVRPYARATCNPDVDSWVAAFIAWWIDQRKTLPDGKPNPNFGIAIKERSGKLRWLIKDGDEMYWFDSKAEAIEYRDGHGLSSKLKPISVTFIPATRYDNPIGMEKDPDYEAKLGLLSRVDRARLMDGNWAVRQGAGMVFKRTDFEIIELEDWERMQKEVVRRLRRWDFAGTAAKKATTPKKMSEHLQAGPDWTVGLKAEMLSDKTIVFTDMVRKQFNPGGVKTLVMDTAKADGRRVKVIIPQDPGQAGKAQVHDYVTSMMGWPVIGERETGSKLTRAENYSTYAQNGKVKILRAAWNDIFLAEHEAFVTEGVSDDIVDCGSGAYRALTEKGPSTTDVMARAKLQGRIG